MTGLISDSGMLAEKRSGFIEAASFCVLAGARTLDPLIKSQLLYQLSYEDIEY